MAKKKEVNWDIIDASVALGASIKTCQFLLAQKDFIVSERKIQRAVEEEKGMNFTEYRNLIISSTTAMKLKQAILKKAFAGDNTCLIFSLKNMANWSDNTKIDASDDVKKVLKLAYNLEE